MPLDQQYDINVLGIEPTATDSFAPKLETETNTEYMARITQAYKDVPQPTLTQAQKDAGAIVKFVRTGASGVGEYKIVYPIGVGFDPITGQPTDVNAFSPSGITNTLSPLATKATTTTTTTTTNPDGPTTNIDVLKAALRGLGFTATILDSSTTFLNSLLKEGLDYDNATEIFLNSKEYTLKNGTKMTSPFYTEYGYLNEGLTVPYSASELFNTVEGYKGVVDKYKLSTKYLTQDNLKQYVKNRVTVANLAERAAMAELRAVESDPFQVEALIKQGYIASATDLKDFYMDSKIGQEQLELNRQTGVFTAEALRRARLGVLTTESQLASFKQLTATLAAKGYSEAQISQLAGTGFENISESITPMSKFTGIYDKQTETLGVKEGLQTELQAEEFLGTASQRRKKYTQLETSTFQSSSGRANISKSSSTAGIL